MSAELDEVYGRTCIRHRVPRLFNHLSHGCKPCRLNLSLTHGHPEKLKAHRSVLLSVLTRKCSPHMQAWCQSCHFRAQHNRSGTCYYVHRPDVWRHAGLRRIGENYSLARLMPYLPHPMRVRSIVHGRLLCFHLHKHRGTKPSTGGFRGCIKHEEAAIGPFDRVNKLLEYRSKCKGPELNC